MGIVPSISSVSAAPGLPVQTAMELALPGPETQGIEKFAKPPLVSRLGGVQPDAAIGCLESVKALAAKTVILFESGSSAVPFRQTQQLRDLADAVSRCPNAKIDVGGHTDRSGEQSSNLQLSWQRAEAVIKQITALGLKTDQFSPVGYSSTRPVTSDAKPNAQGLNRRVEFLVH